MSDDFFEAFRSDVSGQCCECACGKFHFDFNYQYDEECHKDTDKWIEAAEKNPREYQPHDGSICAVVISGAEYVPDCTCRRIESIQEIIDKNAASVAEYLRSLSKRHREYAELIAVPN